MGPYLNISGALMLPESAHDWPLPYYWAHEYLPFFSKAYRPYRIGVITAMCLAAMASIGAAAWIRSVRLRLQVASHRLRAGFSQPHWAHQRPLGVRSPTPQSTMHTMNWHIWMTER